MPQKRNYHVVLNKDDGWDVKREGNPNPVRHAERKSDAVEISRDLAKRDRVDSIIHNKDGKISDRDSYGPDPFPPRDTKH